MDYVFGTIKRNGKQIDILKTVGPEHRHLEGKHIIERKYSDSIITDTFYVADHYLSKDGADGKKYDWYVITDHSRYIDYFTPQKAGIEAEISETQNAVCDLSADLEDVLADIENALCELTEE